MQKEIDLRSYLEVLWKNRKMISIIVLITAIISYIFNYHIRKPIYQAETKLLTKPTEKQTQLQTGEIKDVVENMTQMPAMSLEAYEVQLTSPELLQRTIKDLKLKITVNALQDRISTRIIEKTNYIYVTVRDQDPVMAAKIANTLANNFKKHISETVRAAAEDSANEILERMNEEKIELEQVTKKLSEVTAEPRNLDELIAERKAKLDQVTLYKVMEKDLALTIVTDYETLKQIDKGLVKNMSIPSNITVKLPTISGKVNSTEKVQQEAKPEQKGQEQSNAVQGTKTAEQNTEHNPVLEAITKGLEEEKQSKIAVAPPKSVLDQIEITYIPKANTQSLVNLHTGNLQVELISSIEQYKALETQIAVLKAEIEDLTREIAQKQYRYDIINREVSLAKETFEAYQEKYKETLIKQSAQIGQASIKADEAQVPSVPAGPKRAFGLFVSVLLATVVSIGIAFLKNYYEVYIRNENK